MLINLAWFIAGCGVGAGALIVYIMAQTQPKKPVKIANVRRWE